ncbi:MAG: adenosylcobinamide-GDP ribazoletransferase [Bacteroidales bacterium]|nr:adenosylcobinamide-GDP ribazoletransferase [Bacteroidales bacterium]MBN2749497.1 adenosylcobinamide-GDP ribazoletransferase [Bacteroidales bacterium]
MKKELQVFLSAIGFFTRIPLPQSAGMNVHSLSDAIRYFPLVGAIVGSLSALAFVGLEGYFPLHLSVMLSLVVGILVTGALHEDGFADFCDGYGAGYTKERILSIMKDSSTGVYGAVGIVCMLGVRLLALASLPLWLIPLAFIAAHAYSRFVPVVLMFTSVYVRTDGTSKASVVGSHASLLSLVVAGCIGLASLLLLGVYSLAVIVAVSAVVLLLFRWYITRKTGGYTGDVLGALQQIIEVLVYLTLIAIA